MTDANTIRAVIRYLGLVALALVVGGMLLVRDLITISGAGTIDAAAAAIIGGVFTLAGTTVGALGALLVSTRSGPAEVVNQPGEVLDVAEVPDP